jgi:hypothetical protein
MQRLGKHPLIFARQRLGKHPPIFARQRLGKHPPIVARQSLGRNVTAVPNIMRYYVYIMRSPCCLCPHNCFVFYAVRVVLRKVGDWFARTSCLKTRKVG